MPFQLPPLPNFQTNIPQPPNPVDQMAKVAQLKSMLSANTLQQQLAPLQVQEQQQRVQAAQTENDLQQINLQAQRAQMEFMSNMDEYMGIPKGQFSQNDRVANFLGLDPDDPAMEFVRGMAKAGMPLPAVMANIKGALDVRQTFLKTTEEHQGMVRDDYKQWQDSLAPIKAEADPAARSILIAQAIPKLMESAHTPELKMALKSLTPENFDQTFNMVNAESAFLGLREQKAKAVTAEQGVIPSTGGVSPDTQQQIQKDVAVASNPQIQAGKVAVATAEGAARANIEAQAARGSQAALANVPPHLVAPATEAATKAGTEYAQAQSVSDRLKAMMDDAKKGNVVAYQLIPQEGALQVTTSQGVKRINMAEIQNYGGGSLWQRMEGHLGKALTGKSIPNSVLDDMSEMQSIMAKGNQAKYENTLKTINQNFGSTFKPVDMGGKISVTAPDGSVHPFDTQAQADKFKQLAGIK